MFKISANIDTVLVDELETFIMNESKLQKYYDSVTKDLSKKLKNGKFDKNKATKGLMVFVNEGAKLYQAKFGNKDIDWQKAFPMADRKATAESILDSWLMEENLGVKGFDMTSVACGEDNGMKVEGCPMQDKADLMSQANDLGLTMIIASEISEKTGSLISKFGKLKYDETKQAVESGKYEGDELDFLKKKLAGMDNMKNGSLKAKSMETDSSEVEEKVSDVIPEVTSFADKKSTNDLVEDEVPKVIIFQ